MKYLIFLVGVVISVSVNAEDCLDRADDRYAHEYYSNRYEAALERRRYNNDECNELFEMRKRVRILEDELDAERRSLQQLRIQIERGDK